MTELAELVTGAEIGRRLSVSRVRVSQWSRSDRHWFPAPRGRIGPSVVWEWGAVQRWARERGYPIEPSGGVTGPVGRSPHAEVVGRRRELSELRRLLAAHRLITLAGPPGVGKSRLAVALAAERSGRIRETFVVRLESTREPTQVPRAVAQVLRVREHPRRSSADGVVAHLRARRALLVLDNCEHLVEAVAALVARLVEECSGVLVLVTSREPLGLPGERVSTVPPLEVAGIGTPLAAAARCAAAELFWARAGAAGARLRTEDGAVRTVLEICRRLDGIPLAIELAAARVGVLTPAEIATHLEDRFGLLTGGDAGAAPRHRTLETALDWSYTLLRGPDRAVLRAVSVFEGGFTLDAAEAVCPPGLGEDPVLDALGTLAAKSLLVADTSRDLTRYRLLETVREYAARHAVALGEAPELGGRHARWACALAEQAETSLTGPHQLEWLGRLDDEVSNLRGALTWAVSESDAEIALRLAGSLAPYWRIRGRFREGREQLEVALGLAGPGPGLVPPLSRALRGLGFLALMLDDVTAAVPALERSLQLDRGERDLPGQARSLLLLGNALCMTRLADAPPLLEESIALARRAGDDWCRCHALAMLARVRHRLGEVGAVEELLDECLAVARAAEDPQSLRIGLYVAGDLALDAGDGEAAEAALREGLEVTRALGEPFDIAAALHSLSRVALLHDDPARALVLLGEALPHARRTSNGDLVSLVLSSMGAALLAQAELTAARTACEGAVASAEPDGALVGPALLGLGEVLEREGSHDAARSAYTQALGHARSRGDTSSERGALAGLARIEPADATGVATVVLSPAERRVVELVVDGLANREVAKRLGLSRSTVEGHLHRVYGKLGVTSRTQLVRAALRGGMPIG